MGRSRSVLLIALALLLFPFAANCAHNAGEEVNVYGGTMRPKNHVYEIYSLQQETGCELHDRKYSSWGEVLGRDELFHFFSLKFLNRTSGMRVCSLTATEKRVDRWTEMISQQYMIVVEIDGIRTWSPFGVYQSSGHPPMVYTHRELLIGVNENEIVNVSLHASSPVLLEPGNSYELTFGAVFVQSPTSPLLVLETQIDRHYLDVKIRLASLLNSAVILLFLQALLATITARALRSDISKNDQEKRQRYDGFDTFESTGWRQLHSDVFRVPQYPELLCALLGAGLQLGAFTLGIVGVSAFYSGYVSPTNLIGYFILVYALSCFVGGYVAATEFMNFSRLAPSLSSSWIKCAVLTSCVVPAIACVFGVISNAISLLYGCTHVVGLRSIAWMGCFWLFLSCPLTMGGTIYSRYKSRLVDARRKTPHVNHIPRLVPRSRNVFTPMVLFLLSGILPFASIFVELYLIFSSVWLLKLYYLYSILTVSIILYIGVTISVSGIATFWGLCMENHFWKWKAFGFGCSVSLYAFAYAIYFYAWRTKMQGFLMLALYVCYTLTFVILLGVVSGSISYFGAAILVRKLYSKPSAS